MSILLVAALTLGGCVPKAQYMKLQTENKELKQRVERLDSIAEANLKAYRELLADFKPLIDRGLLKVEVVDGRITLGMASDVLFASGSAELSQAGKDNIGEITKVLAAKSKDRDFQVEGHTDSEPINTPQYPSNWHLGAARAIAVTQFMVDMLNPKLGESVLDPACGTGGFLTCTIEHLKPQLLCLHNLARASFTLIALIKRLELVAPDIRESRRLIGAEQAPLPIRLHALHEQVRDPEGVEEVASTLFLCTRVEF